MFYFAYGSNMNIQQMKKRCPGCKPIKKAYLNGYRFVYDGSSRRWKGGVANIVKDDNGIVRGALYQIDEECLSKLDKYEGYSPPYKRAYNREEKCVRDENGNEYKAWVYLREPREKRKPSEKYQNTIIEGARHWRLPERYISEFIIKIEKLMQHDNRKTPCPK